MKKLLTTGLGIVLSASLILTGCGGNTSSNTDSSGIESTVAASEDAIYGEIASIEENEITINVGEKGSDDDSLTLTGETLTFTVDDNTEYTMEMGGGQAPEMSGDGQTPPDKPDENTGSENNTDNNAATQGSDESNVASNTDGQQTPPEKPDGNTGNQVSTGSTENAAAQGSDESNVASNAGGQQTPPEKPDEKTGGDDSNTDNADGNDGQNNDNAPGEGNAPSEGGMPGGDPGDMTLSLDSLSEGDEIAVVLGDNNVAISVSVIGGNEMGGGPSGQASDNSNITYTAVKTYDEDADVSGESVSSEGTDEEGILVNSGNVNLSDVTVDRTSSDSTGGDNSSFYGVGASILNTGGTLKISDSTITSDAKGGAGVFSYGDGVTYVSDSTITTKQDTSGGIHVAGGGTLYAYDLDVTTNGESSAAIRSDRGGGTMVVDGGNYTSNGTGSPAIYSTADIAVNDATLTANGSEAICIEGENSIRLFNSTLTGNMSDNEQNDCTWNVILYQSMSGDSEEGTATFEMVDGTINEGNGGLFYTTNTASNFILSNTTINYTDDNDFFLKCTGNANKRGWGSTGSNGAQCTFTGISQDMQGDIVWDSISTLDFYALEGSTLTGAVINDESNAGNGGEGYASVYIDDSSKWVVTGDSTLTNLYNEGTIVDKDGNTVTIKGTDGTVYVNGTSDYTITVTTYEETADVSGAGTTDSFSDYAVSL